jgi:hypothetical protein
MVLTDNAHSTAAGEACKNADIGVLDPRAAASLIDQTKITFSDVVISS